MSSIIDRPRPEPDWIIPGLLKRQNVLFLIGKPKLGKSWLLLNLGWDLAEGKPVWNIHRAREQYLFEPSRPMRVLYFSQEDTIDDLQDRLVLMRDAGRVPTQNLWFRPKDLSLVLDTAEGILGIEQVIRNAAPVDLVIFDPLRRMLHGDENSSAVTAGLWRQLDLWGREFNCGFAFAHHTVKPPREKGSKFDETSPFAGRGSGDLFGGGDAFIVVNPISQRAIQHRHPLRLNFESKRAAPLSPVNVSLNIPPGTVVFDDFAIGRPMAGLTV
jgi:RecA-family ATPase